MVVMLFGAKGKEKGWKNTSQTMGLLTLKLSSFYEESSVLK